MIGVDYGTVRIGLAICDPSRTWVSPLTTYERRTEPLDCQFFKEIVKKESVSGWVVGLPIHCDGKESQKSAEARSFADWLELETNLPVKLVDERFSTAFANQLLRPADLSRKQTKKRVDRVAALVILESFLEKCRRESRLDPSSPLDDSP